MDVYRELWITLHLFVHLFQTTVIRCGVMPLGTAFWHFLNYIDQPDRGAGGLERKYLTQNLHTARVKRFGASSYACSTDLPPGMSTCTILDFPPVWLSWKHFSSLRANLFIDYPKGGLHHSWRVTNIYYCLVFYILRVVVFLAILTTLPIRLNLI